MVDRIEMVAAQQLGQLSRVNLVAFVTVFQQGAFPRVAHQNSCHVRLQQVIQPRGPSSFFKRDKHVSAQPLDKLQNGHRLRFDDGLHYQLSCGVHHRDRDRFLVDVHANKFRTTFHYRCSFLLEANAKNLPQKWGALL